MYDLERSTYIPSTYLYVTQNVRYGHLNNIEKLTFDADLEVNVLVCVIIRQLHPAQNILVQKVHLSVQNKRILYIYSVMSHVLSFGMDMCW